MRLNWFSPVPPAKTEIGYHTLRILPALARRAHVTLWTDQDEWDPAVEQFADVRRYENPMWLPWNDVNQAEATFYNVGNNCHFHGKMLGVIERCPGFVILHDLRLQHMFTTMMCDHEEGRLKYVEFMRRYYGSEGQDTAHRFFSRSVTLDYVANHYPLTLAAMEGALGAVVHTRAGLECFEGEDRWPTRWVELPYPARSGLAGSESRRRAGTSKDRFRLILFGHIGPNRRLSSLLRVLAERTDRDRFHLDIYGSVLALEDVKSQIRSLRLKGHVTLHGFVPEAELDAALARADLAINLRFPTMGEASASQLRIWDHALPALVTKIGWYGEQDAETVCFVRPDHEIEDIQHHLDQLVASPEKFVEIGLRGRQTLESRHSPDEYIDQLLRFAGQSEWLHERASAYTMADRAARQLSHWLSGTARDELIVRTAKEIHTLAVGAPAESANQHRRSAA